MRLPSVAGLLSVGALSLGSTTLLTGCPDNLCLLKICQGNQCRCSISSCSEGAAFDTRQNRCRCLKGYLSVAGQCLTQMEANTYCGKGYFWGTAGCQRGSCRPGDELDESTGFCVAQQQIAANAGVAVGPGQKLACPAGTKLVVDGTAAACVPLAQTCARDETWTGQACAKVVQCPTGSIWDAQRAQCVQYAQGKGGGEMAVNANEWATANYGPNGGQGTSAFCGQFAKKPWSFGVVEGQTAIVQISVMLSFPGGEVAKGVVQTTTTFAASGNPVPAKGAAEVDSAARAIFGTLQSGGGRATSPTAATTVKCAVVNAGKPMSIPATGGA